MEKQTKNIYDHPQILDHSRFIRRVTAQSIIDIIETINIPIETKDRQAIIDEITKQFVIH